MQVDDEHLSLTDQKDQVRDPLQVHSQMRFPRLGKQEAGEASAGR